MECFIPAFYWRSDRHHWPSPGLLTAPQAWGRWKELPRTDRSFDLAVFAVGLGVALLLVFGSPWSKELELFYLLLLPVVWIGVRHGLPWCAIAIFVEQSVLVSTVSLLTILTRTSGLSDSSRSRSATTGSGRCGHRTPPRAERYLRQQRAEFSRVTRSRPRALGASVVHEISQPLATVATYIHVCRRLLRSEPIDLKLLERTMISAESEVRFGLVKSLDGYETFWARPSFNGLFIDLTDSHAGLSARSPTMLKVSAHMSG